MARVNRAALVIGCLIAVPLVVFLALGFGHDPGGHRVAADRQAGARVRPARLRRRRGRPRQPARQAGGRQLLGELVPALRCRASAAGRGGTALLRPRSPSSAWCRRRTPRTAVDRFTQPPRTLGTGLPRRRRPRVDRLRRLQAARDLLRVERRPDREQGGRDRSTSSRSRPTWERCCEARRRSDPGRADRAHARSRLGPSARRARPARRRAAPREPQKSLDEAAILGPPQGRPLDGAELDARTRALAERMRCPVCQGLSIAASPSASALAMLAQVRDLLARGYTDEQVLDYFVRSYGEFVLLEPTAQGFNLVVWLLPLAGVGIGAVLIAAAVARLTRAPRRDDGSRRRAASADASARARGRRSRARPLRRARALGGRLVSAELVDVHSRPDRAGDRPRRRPLPGRAAAIEQAAAGAARPRRRSAGGGDDRDLELERADLEARRDEIYATAARSRGRGAERSPSGATSSCRRRARCGASRRSTPAAARSGGARRGSSRGGGSCRRRSTRARRARGHDRLRLRSRLRGAGGPLLFWAVRDETPRPPEQQAPMPWPRAGRRRPPRPPRAALARRRGRG